MTTSVGDGLNRLEGFRNRQIWSERNMALLGAAGKRQDTTPMEQSMRRRKNKIRG